MSTLLALLFLIPVRNAVATPFTVDSSTIYASGGYVGIDTTTFLTGGLFHVAAPANTHTYYDFDRISPSYDSALSWASNGSRWWFLGFLPSAGSANNDLTIYNTSAGKAIQTYQDSTGNVGIGKTNPSTLLDVNGAVTAASSVTASAFFGDGSHLTGVTGSGVTAAGNNAFTGNNTEAGSMTMLSGSTWTIHPNTITGNWIFVSSSDTNGTNSVANTTQTFTLTNYAADTSSVNWRVEWNCYESSSVYFYILFNSDNGAHYSFSSGRFTANAGVGGDGGSADRGIDTTVGALVAGSATDGYVEFQTERALTSNITFSGTGKTFIAAQQYEPVQFSGLYSGSTTPTQINFVNGTATSNTAPSHAGFLNCHMDLFRKGFQYQ